MFVVAQNRGAMVDITGKALWIAERNEKAPDDIKPYAIKVEAYNNKMCTLLGYYENHIQAQEALEGIIDAVAQGQRIYEVPQCI